MRKFRAWLWQREVRNTPYHVLAHRLLRGWYDGRFDGERRKKAAINCLKTLGLYDELVLKLRPK